jgi:2-octaprenyl-6-methoxyphenol hydroxylase
VYSQAEPNHTAWERFTKEGPIALLPCKIDYANQTYNHMVVWCNMQEALPNAHQTNIMQALLGSRVNIKHISWQQSYALGVKLRKQNHAYRTAYLGNALQAIHPVAGQGLNLGLRQAFRVVRAFHQHASLDKNLQNWHNFNPFSLVDKLDQQAILQTTKGMAHGFKYAAISALLGLGLQSIAYSKTLNNSVARLFLYGIRGL